MLFFIPVLRRQTPFTRFLTRAWIVGSVALFLWLGATLVAEERNITRHGVRATLRLDAPAAPGPVQASYVEAGGRARSAPGWLLDGRTIRDLQAGRPVAVEFLPEDPWATVRIVGEHRHGGIVLLVAALFAMLGARYWKRI
jgi:hypothetical protein